MQKLGYVPNAAARSLVTRRTKTIAVVVPEPTLTVFADPFFQAAIGGINSVLVPADYQLVLLMGDPAEQANRLRDFLHSRLADGLVLVSHHGSDGVVETALAAGIPTVLVGRPMTSIQGVAYADLDNELGARLAVRHLLAQGSTCIGIVTGPLDMAVGRDRFEGWHRELGEHALVPGGVWNGDFTRSSGVTAGLAIAEAAQRPDGLVVCSDIMALGVLEAFQRCGIRVPQQLRIVSFDDIPMARYSSPSLTTVVNPSFDLAAAAARLLLEQLDSGAVPDSTVLAPPLIVRESG